MRGLSGLIQKLRELPTELADKRNSFLDERKVSFYQPIMELEAHFNYPFTGMRVGQPYGWTYSAIGALKLFHPEHAMDSWKTLIRSGVAGSAALVALVAAYVIASPSYILTSGPRLAQVGEKLINKLF